MSYVHYTLYIEMHTTISEIVAHLASTKYFACVLLFTFSRFCESFVLMQGGQRCHRVEKHACLSVFFIKGPTTCRLSTHPVIRLHICNLYIFLITFSLKVGV